MKALVDATAPQRHRVNITIRYNRAFLRIVFYGHIPAPFPRPPPETPLLSPRGGGNSAQLTRTHRLLPTAQVRLFCSISLRILCLQRRLLHGVCDYYHSHYCSPPRGRVKIPIISLQKTLFFRVPGLKK